MEQPKVPDPQIVYGRVIFWLCVVAASINVIGPLLSVTFPDNNLMDPQRLFTAIWQGNNPQDVWLQVGGGFPGGHFWVRNLDTGDGLTQLGIVIGCAGLPCLAGHGLGVPPDEATCIRMGPRFRHHLVDGPAICDRLRGRLTTGPPEWSNRCQWTMGAGPGRGAAPAGERWRIRYRWSITSPERCGAVPIRRPRAPWASLCSESVT